MASTKSKTVSYHLAASDLDDPLVTRSMAFLNAGKPRAALELVQSIKGWRCNPLALKYSGCAALDLEGPAKAKHYFHQLYTSARDETDAASALANLGECWFREGSPDISFELALRAIELAPRVIIPWFTAAESIVKVSTRDDVERFAKAFHTALPDLLSRPVARRMLFRDPALATFRESPAFKSAYSQN